MWFPLAAPGEKEAGVTQFSISRQRQKNHFKQQIWESALSREAKAGSQTELVRDDKGDVVSGRESLTNH